ncbi:hypothetical protein DL96DRAFT_1813848 [Flagelloscypha sp. PMI_526]|nr:hypothetical protein DL96DRAFT_1813848 [Flagelloscypha sp. PMI_526]
MVFSFCSEIHSPGLHRPKNSFSQLQPIPPADLLLPVKQKMQVKAIISTIIGAIALGVIAAPIPDVQIEARGPSPDPACSTNCRY